MICIIHIIHYNMRLCTYCHIIIHDMYNTYNTLQYDNMYIISGYFGLMVSVSLAMVTSPSGAHALIAVPGGVDGPSGVLVGLQVLQSTGPDGSWRRSTGPGYGVPP